MLSIILETADGGYVGHATIPPFQKLPEVVTWGSRTFALHEPEQAVYREVCNCVIVTEVTDQRPE